MEQNGSTMLPLDGPATSAPAVSREIGNMRQTKKKRRSILKMPINPTSEREALKVG